MPEQSMVLSQNKDLEKQGKKFTKWCEAFLNPESPTKGNATKSALTVYKKSKYHTAAAIGHQNYKKLQLTGLAFEEADGRGIEAWYKILAAKAMNGSYEQVADFMERIGILEKPTKIPANQNNLQFNFGNLAEQFAQARRERGLDVPDQNKNGQITVNDRS